ncbi:EamA family transporter [Halomonas eurihalina]|uniref:EamA family transporter n=1 Tax=Halomonas eurihalina TaxID=42566 RepID=A0A5D9DAX2_HALER|nr:EamA family transporter [Halomonas eurihalina]MDR5858560.1 EamA family transporter [Halomonas eurihalina]TZG40749.1 EamA family transporter [Halomonas eurihalina]
MTTPVFLAVLASALMHASWNALVKVGLDRLLSISLIQVGCGIIALFGVAFVPLPNAAAWPWLLVSVILHIGYNIFLARSYRVGDLGQIYPIARGCAPLLVTLIGIALLSDQPSALGYAGIGLLVLGILCMAFPGGRHYRLEHASLVNALITSAFIAGYTLADGSGARANGDAIGYVIWLFLLDGCGMLLVLVALHGTRTLPQLGRHWRVGLIGGALSLGAYGVTIWAMTQAPIALVAALRETSVLFAIAIGMIWLKEPLRRERLLAGGLILAGVVLTHWG